MFSLAALVLLASAPDASAWASKVQKAYEGLKDYSAGFEQQAILKTGPGPKATGKVYLAKPGKMRWEFESPDKKTVVSDGKTMWVYDPEENQVLVQEHLELSTSLTALNFLSGLGQLGKDFDVSPSAPRADASDPKAVFLSLKPKPTADVQLAEIVLEVDPRTSLANEVYLVDGLGNQTRLTFKSPQVNRGLKASTFTFTIPKDAEVINPTAVAPPKPK